MIHDFKDRLTKSLGDQAQRDIEYLKSCINGCESVCQTDDETDREGVDYICSLRGGAEIFVDAKARDKGASRFWKYGEPELALEKWSAVPDGRSKGKAGWTLSESDSVDYILYTFDPSDSQMAYLLPFQALRNAFIEHYQEWSDKYCIKRQKSQGGKIEGSWESEAVFVPASVVMNAINDWEQIDITKLMGRDQEQKGVS